MLNKLIKSILAGISIALGAVIYLLCSNKIVGARFPYLGFNYPK